MHFTGAIMKVYIKVAYGDVSESMLKFDICFRNIEAINYMYCL